MVRRDMPDERGIERHASTLIGAAIFGVLAWQLYTVQGLSLDVARLSEQIAGMRAEVERGTDHRYRSTDAVRDFATRDQRLDAHAAMLRELADRVRVIENRNLAEPRN